MNPRERLQLLNEILDEILLGVREFLEAGEIMSPELQRMLSEELEYLNSEIEITQQQIQAENAPPELPQGPLTPGPYPSSNINAFKYDPRSKQLWVKFHGKDTADSGPTYMYQNIPDHLFEVFRRGGVAPITSGRNRYHQWYRGVTPSLGAAMYHLIKQGGYAYQQVA